MAALGVAERESDQDELIEKCAGFYGCFVDHEFNGGVAVSALCIVTIADAHQRVTVSAGQLQCAGL